VRKILSRGQEFRAAIEASGLESLPKSDRLVVSRARKIEKCLTQPFFVAEPYTGTPGQSVTLSETLRGCNAILNGELDELPEQKLDMIGALGPLG